MIPAKDAHTLSAYYEKAYQNKYGNKPIVNRNTAKWGWDGIVSGGMSLSEVKSLVDFYFETGSTNNHALNWFFNNYDRLVSIRLEVEKDREYREKLRRESQERAQKWREKFGNQGITGN